MKAIHNLARKASGFTLIELLVVIAIIGVLATVVLVSLNSARMKSRDAKRVADIRQVMTAVELFFNDCGGYPSTWQTSASNGCPAGTDLGDFISPLPTNPSPGGSAYTYSGGGATYSIGFTLEGQTGQLAAGAHTATPGGIQ